MKVFIIVKSYDWGEEYGNGWEIDKVIADKTTAYEYAKKKNSQELGVYGYAYSVEEKEIENN